MPEITDTGVGVEHSTQEDAEFLAEGEEKELEKKVEEPEEKEKEEEEKEEEKEEELEEEPDETKDQVKARPAFKEITGKYPNLFKDFPDLREMYFREQEYTKAFPTVEDAKEAAEIVERFNSLDELVSSGKVEDAADFFKFIKESDEGVHNKFAMNFLPALSKSDPDLHYQILTPVAQDLIQAVFAEGSRLGEEAGKNLRNAALHFSQYYFNDLDVAKGKKVARVEPVDDSAKQELDREREAFYAEKYESSLQGVESRIGSILSKEIKKSLDPKGDTFNDFMLDTLTEKVLKSVDVATTKDTSHMARIASLWKQARKASYSKESTDRLVSAYLSRARQLLPEIKNKIRSDALSNKSTEKSNATPRRDISGGGQQRFSVTTDPKKIDYHKTSDRDILDDKVTLRK